MDSERNRAGDKLCKKKLITNLYFYAFWILDKIV